MVYKTLEQRTESLAARNQRLMCRRQAILYANIVSMKKREEWCKVNWKIQENIFEAEDKNAANVTMLLKNVQVPKIVKKNLIFGEVLLSKDLNTSYENYTTCD